MEKAIERANDPAYQAIFLQHVTLAAPAFIQNEDEAKLPFLFQASDVDSIAHDNIIQDAYAFLSTGQGLFAITAPRHALNETRIIFIDDEAQIYVVGTTVMDFVINLEYLTLDYETRDIDGFLAACEAQFGYTGPALHFFALNAL